MNLAVLNIALAFGWALATGSFTLLNLLFGAVIGGLGLWMLREHVSSPKLFPRLRRVASLSFLFTFELIVSALRMARLSLRLDMDSHLHPAFIAFPLKATRDAEITLLANLITLTPGTLSVAVSDDKRFLYIHAIDAGDRETFIAELSNGFEKKVMEVFE
ncbi:Na+/H+ antiporter subunit E [Devosia sp.]|uniref:Na+/H+ antiporter subunit E n=1 Tax=Devosia sp. TaxID=1871048 RepID=UPI003A9123E0